MAQDCGGRWLNWEILHCLGCNEREPYIVDHKSKQLWLCKRFAEDIYMNVSGEGRVKDRHGEKIEMDVPTTKFDECGFV